MVCASVYCMRISKKSQIQNWKFEIWNRCIVKSEKKQTENKNMIFIPVEERILKMTKSSNYK